MKRVFGVVGLILFVCAVVVLYAVVQVVQIPTSVKLADCKSKIVRTTFVCPKGEMVRLLIGTPPKNDVDYKGQILISQDGKVVATYSFSSTSSAGTNWLERHKLRSIVVSSKKGRGIGQAMDTLLKVGEVYDLVATFEKAPPSQSSLWLNYLQQPFKLF